MNPEMRKTLLASIPTEVLVKETTRRLSMSDRGTDYSSYVNSMNTDEDVTNEDEEEEYNPEREKLKNSIIVGLYFHICIL